MKTLRLAKPLPSQATDAFSRGYVESLRQEVKKVRETALQAAARAEGLEAARAEDKARADARLITAVLRVLATQARIVDLDALQLADTSTVTVDPAGEVCGAVEVIEALRRDKPFLFEGVSTSSSARPPAPSR